MRSKISFLHFIFLLCAGAVLAKELPRPRSKEPSGALPLRSSAETSRDISVQGAINVALRNNRELRVFQASIAGSKGGVTTARTFANPELTLTTGVKRTREAGITNSEFHGEFELSQLFKFPGKRVLEIAIAQRNVAIQQLALEAFRFQLAAKVRRSFYDMLAAQKIIGLRKEQVDSAKSFVESALKRAESGYASDFETLKSQAELIAARKALQQAEGEIVAARVSLNTLMGRTPDAPLEVRGSLENVVSTGSTGEFLALAMARNPSLRAQAKHAEVAGLALRSRRFGRRPDFAVGPSVEYTDTEQIYGLRGRIALPFWDQKRGEIETALGEQQKALAEIENTRAEITGEVTKAAAELQVARDAAALYTTEFLDKLKAFVTQAEQGYAQSATTLIIYLDAKRTYFDALSDYYEALGKVAAGRAALESAIGVPLEANRP